MNSSGFNMYVFRDGRRNVAGQQLRNSLTEELRKVGGGPGELSDRVLNALISAGELECGLSDHSLDEISKFAERWTDAIAAGLVGGGSVAVEELIREIEGIDVPERLDLSVHEGFAYYALHPLKFVKLVDELVVEWKSEDKPQRVAVIGIRSVGATLSAVVKEAFREGGVEAERMTVRPHGHPYERMLACDAEFRGFVERHAADKFVIVDEGPGISGSSFLSVAEALEPLGVGTTQITMLGSRWVEAAQLKTPKAAERWPRCRFMAVAPEPMLPIEAETALGGGIWRRHFLKDFENQPASWTQLESSKYLSRDGRSIFKFEGFGRFGEDIGTMAEKLERHGFGAPYQGNERGFGRYAMVEGRMLSREDLSEELIRRMAGYCAFRQREFQVEATESKALEDMMRWNYKCEFGEELEVGGAPEVKTVVLTDSRMMPHEWMATANGFLKLDACSHGDNHFFPGPTDIAWDLAGVIVEWEMDDRQREEFIVEYQSCSGDAVSERLAWYLLAYSVFRMGWSKMAAASSGGEFDEGLLVRDHRRYREVVKRLAEMQSRAAANASSRSA